jgi:hypothetical protein
MTHAITASSDEDEGDAIRPLFEETQAARLFFRKDPSSGRIRCPYVLSPSTWARAALMARSANGFEFLGALATSFRGHANKRSRLFNTGKLKRYMDQS